ncbi:MAG TPA: hypothetical protein VK835_11125 [Bacteroidia bacterium]|jgi:hypothetical protein|nr:hypothetical protein [Bacteroidia bacterium]
MKKLLFIFFSLLTSISTLQAGNVKAKTAIIEPQNFSAICNGERIDISWKATTGVGDVCFTIEKSKDGVNFTKVIDVLSTSICSGCRDYAERDYKPYKGVSYYRLKQTDKKGNCNYFAVVTVNFVPQKNLVVYHAPLNAGANLNTNEYGHEVVVVLRDVQGKELVSKVWLMAEKNVVFLMDEKNTVPAGSYIITSSSDDKIRNYKLVVR